MKKTVILFGATGNIGAYTALDLIVNGYSVIAVGKRSFDNNFFVKNGCHTYISLDICKKTDFDKLPDKDVFAVVHLAGALPARDCGCDAQKFIDSIITGTLNVLDYSVKVGVNRIVFAHSQSDINYLFGTTKLVREDAISKFPLNDDHSVYAICKNTAVNLIEHYYHKYGLKRYILRLPNIYLFHPNKYYYVDGIRFYQPYRKLIDKAIKGELIEVWGDPSRVRDMIYVKDLTRIIIGALGSVVDGGMYNAGTGIGISLDMQIKGIIDVFTQDKRSDIVYKPECKNAPQYIFDISKTVQDLNYVPIYDYYAYLRDMKKEMELNRFKELWGEE